MQAYTSENFRNLSISVLTKKKCKNSDIEIDQLHEHLASLFGGNTEENRNVDESTFEYVEDDDLDSPISEQEWHKPVFKQNIPNLLGQIVCLQK